MANNYLIKAKEGDGSMKNKYFLLHGLILFSSILIMTGCGGGGGGGGRTGGGGGSEYTGSTEPAAITDTNAEEIGVGTSEAAAKAIEADSADTSGLPFGVSIAGGATPSQQAQDINQKILEVLQASSLPMGLTLSGNDFASIPEYCGGSVTVPDNFNGTSGTITYNNFCLDSLSIYGKMTVNGSITLSGGLTTFTYSNLTIRFENGTYITCNGSSTSSLSCSSNIVYSGAGGTAYRVSNVSVTGNATSGYYINASYCHSTYGCVTIGTSSPIVLDPPCANGKPSSGTITFSSTNGSSGTITFNSCNSYTVTYITTAGGGNSISGTW